MDHSSLRAERSCLTEPPYADPHVRWWGAPAGPHGSVGATRFGPQLILGFPALILIVSPDCISISETPSAVMHTELIEADSPQGASWGTAANRTSDQRMDASAEPTRLTWATQVRSFQLSDNWIKTASCNVSLSNCLVIFHVRTCIQRPVVLSGIRRIPRSRLRFHSCLGTQHGTANLPAQEDFAEKCRKSRAKAPSRNTPVSPSDNR